MKYLHFIVFQNDKSYKYIQKPKKHKNSLKIIKSKLIQSYFICYIKIRHKQNVGLLLNIKNMKFNITYNIYISNSPTQMNGPYYQGQPQYGAPQQYYGQPQGYGQPYGQPPAYGYNQPPPPPPGYYGNAKQSDSCLPECCAACAAALCCCCLLDAVF